MRRCKRHVRRSASTGMMNTRFGLLAWCLGPCSGSWMIALLRQALDINPNFFLAYGSLGTTLAFAGQADESIENTMICIRLNPRDPSIFFRYSSLSLAHFLQ